MKIIKIALHAFFQSPFPNMITSDLSLQMEDGKLHPNFVVYFKIFGHNECDWFSKTELNPNMKTMDLKDWYQNERQCTIDTFYRASTNQPLRNNETLRSFTDHKGLTLFAVNTTIPIKFKWINEFKSTKHEMLCVRSNMRISEVVRSFQSNTCQDAVFNQICFGSKRHTRSRLSTFGSIKNCRLSDFYKNTGGITIEFSHKSMFYLNIISHDYYCCVNTDFSTRREKLECVCGTALKWVSDCVQSQSLRKAVRKCQCCGNKWNTLEEDQDCVLWCSLGITQIHPNGFFVCEKCTSKVRLESVITC